MDNRYPRLQDNEWFQQWFGSSGDYALVFDESLAPVYASPAWDKPGNEKRSAGRAPMLTDYVHEDDAAGLAGAALQLFRSGCPAELEFRIQPPGRKPLWLKGRLFALMPSDGPMLGALAAHDITAYKEQMLQLTHLAYSDPLTGLPNRRLLMDRLQQSMLSAKRHHRLLAVLYVDLDDFKRVNDQHGHSAGDELLQTAAKRLRRSLRDPDTVCRMGGDEFVVLLDQFENKKDVVKIIQRIAAALSEPFELSGRYIEVTCSIGGAIYPCDASTADALIHMADTAMYSSKRHGKNRYALYGE